MSAKRDDLFLLIQSMSKTEKRYFKMESKKAGDKTSNHVKLFDAINNLDEYNEDVLKKKLKKEKFIAHLSAEKRYLYNALLKSIRNFRGDQFIFTQIKTMVIDANYLLERTLYDQAEKILDKAERLAIKIDDTVSLLEINLKKQEVLRAQKRKRYESELFSLMDKKDEVLDLLLTKLKLRDILNQVGTITSNKMYNNNKIVIDLVNKNTSILNASRQTNSFCSILWGLLIKSELYKNIGDFEKLYEIRSEIIEHWNQHPEIKEEFFYLYLFDINNIIGSYFNLKKREKGFEVLKNLENEKPKNYFNQAFLFKRVAIKKLLYLMTEGDFDIALQLVPGIEAGLKKYTLNKGSEITLKLNIATLYFCLHDFESCLIWANKITDGPKYFQRIDIQRHIRLMVVVAKIELGVDYNDIDNFCRATHRFFVKSGLKEKSDPTHIMLDYLWKFHDSPISGQKDILRDFKLVIENIQTNPLKKSTLGLEEFHFWIRSKLEKKPMSLLIKESNGSSN